MTDEECHGYLNGCIVFRGLLKTNCQSSKTNNAESNYKGRQKKIIVTVDKSDITLIHKPDITLILTPGKLQSLLSLLIMATNSKTFFPFCTILSPLPSLFHL